MNRTDNRQGPALTWPGQMTNKCTQGTSPGSHHQAPLVLAHSTEQGVLLAPRAGSPAPREVVLVDWAGMGKMGQAVVWRVDCRGARCRGQETTAVFWMDIGVGGAEGVFGNEEMQGNGGITRSILQMEKLRLWVICLMVGYLLCNSEGRS